MIRSDFIEILAKPTSRRNNGNEIMRIHKNLLRTGFICTYKESQFPKIVIPHHLPCETLCYRVETNTKIFSLISLVFSI
jgi:hypothetical protein